ncbi:MAG: YnbE family lipoprotein [Parvibaculum sp.]|nr:YnbE family lipoprotein [Parvibaculum sp.]
MKLTQTDPANNRGLRLPRAFALAVGVTLFAAGCNPTVKIEAPDKPIEINLNIKIEQEIRIKVDRDLDQLLADNPDLF